MPTLQTSTLRDVRCACVRCGAHLIGTLGHTLSGQCPNCGSYEVRALPAPRDVRMSVGAGRYGAAR